MIPLVQVGKTADAENEKNVKSNKMLEGDKKVHCRLQVREKKVDERKTKYRSEVLEQSTWKRKKDTTGEVQR
jgi:hypothetical protein